MRRVLLLATVVLSCACGRASDAAVAEWEQVKRPQVLSFFDNDVYGRLPPPPAKLEFELAEYGYAFGGLAHRRQYVVHATDAKGTLSFNVLLYVPREIVLPTGGGTPGKAPTFVYPNFCGNWTLTDDPKVFAYKGYVYPAKAHMKRGSRPDRVCLEEILRRGYAFATFCFNEVCPDDFFHDVTAESVWGIFDPSVLPEEKLAHPAWSWGAMRVRDLLAGLSVIDQNKVAIVGQSRMGKNAIETGVHDARFALVCANCGGTKSLRHLPNLLCPTWFSQKLTKYVQIDRSGIPVAELERLAEGFPPPPYDQGDYIACIAPRAVVISVATQDQTASPDGSKAILDAAAPVFALYGKTIGWHLKDGTHSITHEDWRWFMDYADRDLGWKIIKETDK